MMNKEQKKTYITEMEAKFNMMDFDYDFKETK